MRKPCIVGVADAKINNRGLVDEDSSVLSVQKECAKEEGRLEEKQSRHEEEEQEEEKTFADGWAEDEKVTPFQPPAAPLHANHGRGAAGH